MDRSGKTAGEKPSIGGGAGRGKRRSGETRETGLAPDRLTARAKEGDEEAFLSLVRFHSTFNPIPLTPEILRASGLDEITRTRLSGRLKRKEDRLLRPFPGIDMMFWGEGEPSPTARFSSVSGTPPARGRRCSCGSTGRRS